MYNSKMAVFSRNLLRFMRQGVSFEKNINFIKSNFSTSMVGKVKAGDVATATKTFTHKDIQAFADVTGDHNPLHLDPDYAKKSSFGACIVHGSLTLGLVSGIIARELPGPGSVLLKQTVEYPAALMVGEQVEVRIEVTSYRHSIAKLELLCKGQEEKVVLRGQVLVKYDPAGKA